MTMHRLEVRPSNLPVQPQFKVNIYWGPWSPQITARILRDMFILARLAKINRTTLTVASAPELRPYLKQLGIVCTEDFTKPQLARVYVEEECALPLDLEERMPEDVDWEVVSLNTNPLEPQAGPTVPDAPYANMPLKQTWRWIPETMPLERAPPRGLPAEPGWAPYFVWFIILGAGLLLSVLSQVLLII
jgi:hypothetical protein